jgi:aryl-alcohol dehydrogenase-like predicted oxidoreductase
MHAGTPSPRWPVVPCITYPNGEVARIKSSRHNIELLPCLTFSCIVLHSQDPAFLISIHVLIADKMASVNNRLILGTMTIGPDTDKGARITSLDTYKECLDYLEKKGYKELDTAAAYVGGLQEGFTREAGFQERGFTIASKVMPLKPRDHGPENLPKAWDISLGKLGIDSTDIFYLHAPDRSLKYEETLETVDRMYREGKFKKLGLSNYTSWEVAEIVGICERR